MKKRDFLATAAVGGFMAPLGATQVSVGKAPVLLTVSGAISKPNRGAFDPVFDQMMGKQKLAFDKARVFDFAELAAMPSTTIRPTLEYDGKPHTLRGPLLSTVLKAVGAPPAGKLAMRAIDGYAPAVPVADALKYRFIIATHLDGRPMPLGGLGPLWALYEPDRFPDMAAKPVNERFALCPWGLYHIDVQA